KIREKKYSDDVINDMYALITAESKDKVKQIFEKIQMADERCKLDKERFTSINIHQKYNVSNRERDKGPVTHNVQSNKRKAKAQTKKSTKCKYTSSGKKKPAKVIMIHSDDSENDYLALKEREFTLREREAKICVMELNNLVKKHELELIRK
ncbi:12531_t:CDS:2, partial [Funneliformis geosporum]